MNKPNSGFTLVEMLITLSGLFIIVSFMPMLLNIQWIKEHQSERFSRLEWQVFARQITSEVREAREMEIKQSTLYLYKFNGEKVSFEKYGNLIRRRVNGQGHEISLQYISGVQYKLEHDGLRIKVMTEQGKEYEMFIMTFFQPKEKVS
ncbi:competence protein ComGF [Anoxybacillus calidus]|jgi:competence protein ComGF|uniref:Competence protein ComGF n=1 Tax=[Anoxybacillus] calidus TaxID=575178 RepID=A0A7V9YWS7_9BACL|nr:competence type IV pilus minor pilin ComGF [Anoxybacillus calidus]MBA2869912.1 competence protein ComGF [Anoxybacillus calidus]